MSGMVFDTGIGKIVLFGGRDQALNRLAYTWEYDGSNWTQRTIATPPPAREGPGMAFDPTRGRTVLFGGFGGGGNLGDTWELDGTGWTMRSNSGPTPRETPCMSLTP